jgi:hypothetical protein
MMDRRSALAALAASLVASSQIRAGGRMLHYDPAVVTLVGRLGKQRWYGPPGYGEDPKHDRVETYLLLYLDRPISVAATPDEDAHSDVSPVQLAAMNLQKLFLLVGHRVRLRGTLFEGFTGHHVTPVLLWVEHSTVLSGARRPNPGGPDNRVLGANPLPQRSHLFDPLF